MLNRNNDNEYDAYGEALCGDKPAPQWQVGWHPGCPMAPFPMCFTPEAMESLLKTVGSEPPEAGAKGFGPMDRMGFDVIEFDIQGSQVAGGAVYGPDEEWGRQRCEYHLGRPGAETRVWNGDIHSHPGGCGHPSPPAGKGLGDLGYVQEVFEQNETMQFFSVPILTNTGNEEPVTIHPWVVRRDGLLMIADLKVCQVDEFPERQYNPEWLERVEAEKAPRREVLAPPKKEGRRPDGVASGTDGAPAKQRLAVVSESLASAYDARLAGVVSDEFHTKTILVVGVGAGAYMVEKMARLRPRKIKICDFDVVAVANLSRTLYTMADALAARPKALALAHRIEEVNPLVKVKPYVASITEMTESELDELFEGVDLVIGGTDRLAAQDMINRQAVARGKPAVFIGIHAGAQGGRVIWTVPGETPCYRCVARDRFEAAENGQGENVDLTAARGSLLDCQFIDMLAAKVAVAILERGQNSAMGRFFKAMSGRNDIVVRCDPDPAYWGNQLLDVLLGDLPTEPKDYARELKETAFLTMDSLWLKGEYDPECPVCSGQLPERKSYDAR